MKKIFTLLLVSIISLTIHAQWSNTTNRFTDSLQMPVCIETGIQQKSITIKSYPDSGYIIFWQDNRISANQTDIYAQKYDKKGVAHWAAKGIPVAAGTDDEPIAQASNADYRNYSYAVTDSAGGFFIAYQKTVRIGSYDCTGITVQHLDAAGTAAYPGEGFMVAQHSTSDVINYTNPQLIADGKKGFFVSYVKSANFVYVAAYRFTANSFQPYALQLMNEDVYQISSPGACFIHHTIEFKLPTVYDYQIWPDEQGGCNVIMNLNASTGDAFPQRLLAYNAVKRVKKACTTLVLKRTNDLVKADPVITHYQRDSIIRLYNLHTYFWTADCATVIYTNDQIENLGFGYLIISTGNMMTIM